jgi:ArsR family transcriptional regulator
MPHKNKKSNPVVPVPAYSPGRTRAGQRTGNHRPFTCKETRFHTEKISEARNSLPPEYEIVKLSKLDSTMTSTWQQRIIFALAKGRLCVCDIAYVIGLSIPATSRQLAHLHERKLVSYEHVGKMLYCSLNNGVPVGIIESA